jgi:hypothetical protein
MTARRLPLAAACTAALLTLAAGALWAVATWKQADRARDALARRAREHAALTAIQAGLQADEAARDALRAVEAAPPALAELLARYLPDFPPNDARPTDTDLEDGWILKRIELSFAHAPVGRVMAFVATAEQAVTDAAGRTRPGWRLSRCAVHAAAGQPGWARMALVLQTPVQRTVADRWPAVETRREADEPPAASPAPPPAPDPAPAGPPPGRASLLRRSLRYPASAPATPEGATAP